VYTVLPARILNVRLAVAVVAVSNHNPKSKINDNTNPIPNPKPDSLLQSRCQQWQYKWNCPTLHSVATHFVSMGSQSCSPASVDRTAEAVYCHRTLRCIEMIYSGLSYTTAKPLHTMYKTVATGNIILI